MLTITNGSKTLRVTRGAYEEYYKTQGWGVLLPPESSTSSSIGPEVESKEEVWETTLEDMTFEELKQYASLLGIKIKNIKDPDQLMELIKSKEKE